MINKPQIEAVPIHISKHLEAANFNRLQ